MGGSQVSFNSGVRLTEFSHLLDLGFVQSADSSGKSLT